MASISTTAAVLPLLLLLLLPPLASASKCNKDDKRALLSIKSAFNNAYHFASWTSTSACCDCLRFHKLPLLVGNIPSAITRLTRLSVLTLSWNALSGPIPPFLSQIPSLTIVDLSFNLFSGSIPAELANLPALLGLDFSRNRLTGPIPSSFGNFPKASPPQLVFNHNNLSGDLPRELGVPEWSVIDLSRNKLTGDASFLFGAEKATQRIDLSRNEFAFDLSKVTFPVNLTSLDLNHNEITGAIPAQINQVERNFFSEFNVSYNRLCGAIPAGVITAKFGVDAYFHNKCLCGPPLPACA
ncbi:Polygalacturonase inhibitor 2 [Platanthera guangdongensis]|uniref:Polygalacturonase inhibitor 2 n=1 Tax=Platanthera guangdongensis TaxID=2320717 RepID=A0ABR2M0E9_9ASPA